MSTPVETIWRAAALMRERAGAVRFKARETRPWKAEACAERECPCIVIGNDAFPDTVYIADAEEPEYAAHIASWHPQVALAVADWLEHVAELAAVGVSVMPDDAFDVARAYLGEGS